MCQELKWQLSVDQSSEETEEEDESSDYSEETAPKKRRPVIPGERKSERERQSVSVAPDLFPVTPLQHAFTSQMLCLGINGIWSSRLYSTYLWESADKFGSLYGASVSRTCVPMFWPITKEHLQVARN